MNFNNISALSIILLSLYKSNQNDDFVYTLWGVFRAVFDLRPNLVVNILNFEPFVTRVADMDATVEIFQPENIKSAIKN